MPSTPYAKVLVAIDSGAPQSGGIEHAGNCSVQLYGESLVGWLRARWEIIDYPEGWTTPTGWTLGSDGVIYYLGITPPVITLPDALVLWGKWNIRLIINEQIDDDQKLLRNGELFDDQTIVSVRSPGFGLSDLSALEKGQFTSSTTRQKKWTRDHQKNLRRLEQGLIAALAAAGSGSSALKWSTGNLELSFSSSFGPVLLGDGTISGTAYEFPEVFRLTHLRASGSFPGATSWTMQLLKNGVAVPGWAVGSALTEQSGLVEFADGDSIAMQLSIAGTVMDMSCWGSVMIYGVGSETGDAGPGVITGFENVGSGAGDYRQTTIGGLAQFRSILGIDGITTSVSGSGQEVQVGLTSGLVAPARGGFGQDMSLATGIPSWNAGSLSLITTSAGIAAAIGDETGSGSLVFANTPTLITPAITTSAAITNSGIAATSADGLLLQNATVTTNVTQAQNSPRVRLLGHGWTGSVDQQGEWWSEIQGQLTTAVASGGTSITPLVWSYRQDGGATKTVAWLNPLGSLNIRHDDIRTATTGLTGLLLYNDTLATAGIPTQYAPRIRFIGSAYNSVSTLTETQDWLIEFHPLTAAGATTGSLVFGWDRDGSGVGGSLFRFGSDSLLTITRDNNVVAHNPSILLQNTTAATAGVPRQISPTLQVSGTYWNGSASKVSFWDIYSAPSNNGPVGQLSFRGNLDGVEDQYLFVQTTGEVGLSPTIVNPKFSVYFNVSTGTTSTDAFLTRNLVAATVGVPVQYSGRVRWSGTAWDTDDSVSRPLDAIAELRPISGTTVGSTFAIATQIAGLGYTDQFTLGTDGTVTFSEFIHNSSGFGFGSHTPTGSDDFFHIERNTVNGSTTVLVKNLNAGNVSDAAVHIFGEGSDTRLTAQSTALGALVNWSGNNNTGMNILQLSNARLTTWIPNGSGAGASYPAGYWETNGSFNVNNYDSPSTPGKAATTQLRVVNQKVDALAAVLVNLVTDVASFGITVYSDEYAGSNSSLVQLRAAAAKTVSFIVASNAPYDVYTNNVFRERVAATGGKIVTDNGTARNPVASAILELNSTTGALVLPRMTTTQRNALTPLNGMEVYDSTASTFYDYLGGAWVDRYASGISTSFTVTRNNITTTSTDGFVAQNTTAATGGVMDQWSPRIHLIAQAWDGSASQTLDWIGEIQTTSGASFHGDLVYSYQQASGGFVEAVRFITSAAGATDIGGAIQITRKAIGATSTTGFATLNTTLSLVGTQNQWSPRFIREAHVWGDDAADHKVEWIDEIQTTGAAASSYNGDWVGSYQLSSGGYNEKYRWYGLGGLLITNNTPGSNVPEPTGVTVRLTVASSAGTTSRGPAPLIFSGTAWDGFTGNVSRTTDFRLQMIPKTSTASLPVGATLEFAQQVDGGGWQTLSRINLQNGGHSMLGDSSRSGSFTATANTTGIGTVFTAGLALTQPVAAISGTQQDSLGVQLQGTGWNTSAGTSRNDTWRFFVRPIQGTFPTSSLIFQNANGTAQEAFSLTSTCAVVGTPLGGFVTVTNRRAVDTVTEGCILTNTIAATAGHQAYGPWFESKGTAWTVTSSVSRTVSWRWYSLGIQQASNEPSADLVFETMGGAGTIFEGIRFVGTQVTGTQSGASIQITQNGIGSVSTRGLLIQNTTASSAGSQRQYSPRIRQSGTVWDSAASQTVDWIQEVQVTAGATYVADLVYSYQKAGGGYQEMFRLGSQAANGTPTGATATLTLNAIAATSTDGLVLTNTTASNGTTTAQWASRLRFHGTAWNSTGSANETHDWYIEMQPVTAAGTTTSSISFLRSINGGAYATQLTITSAGAVTATGALSGTSATITNAIVSTAGRLESRVGGLSQTSTDALVANNQTAATSGTPVQISGRIRQIGAIWDGGASRIVDWKQEWVGTSGAAYHADLIWAYQNAAGGFNEGFRLAPAAANGTPVGVVATQTLNAIATTASDGIVIQNTTASTAGVTAQYSPGLRFYGTAYNSTSTLSETQEFRVLLRTITVAGATSSTLAFARSLNGAAYTDAMTLNSAGLISSVQLALTSTATVTRANITTTSTDAFIATNTTAATSGAQNQWSPRFRYTGQVWDGTVTRTVDFITELQTVGSGATTYSSDLVTSYQKAAGGYTATKKEHSTGGMFIADQTAVPGTPTAGGELYSDAGAGKWKGSGGTTTTFGPAEVDGFKDTKGHGHCPECGTDFALEWSNPKYGSLTVCMRCLVEEVGDRPFIVRKHAHKKAA